MIVRLPASLSQSGKSGMVDLEVAPATTLRGLLTEIERQVPGATKRIIDDSGKLYGFVNLYVNGNNVRHGDGMETVVSERDEVLILPAISGG